MSLSTAPERTLGGYPRTAWTSTRPPINGDPMPLVLRGAALRAATGNDRWGLVRVPGVVRVGVFAPGFG